MSIESDLKALVPPGEKTTEFWVAGIGSPLLGLALLIFASVKVTDPVLQGEIMKWGGLFLSVGPFGYALSRGFAKFGHFASVVTPYIQTQQNNLPGFGSIVGGVLGVANGGVPGNPPAPVPAPTPTSDVAAAQTIANLP